MAMADRLTVVLTVRTGVGTCPLYLLRAARAQAEKDGVREPAQPCSSLAGGSIDQVRRDVDGRGEIRTPETGVARLPVFKILNDSPISWLARAKYSPRAPVFAPVFGCSFKTANVWLCRAKYRLLAPRPRMASGLLLALGSLVVGIQERDGVGFASGKEVSVAVDCDRDRGVPDELADFVDRDPSVEHLRNRGVATVLQPDRTYPLRCGRGVLVVFSLARSRPRLTGAFVDGAALERLGWRVSEDEVGA